MKNAFYSKNLILVIPIQLHNHSQFDWFNNLIRCTSITGKPVNFKTFVTNHSKWQHKKKFLKIIISSQLHVGINLTVQNKWIFESLANLFRSGKTIYVYIYTYLRAYVYMYVYTRSKDLDGPL